MADYRYQKMLPLADDHTAYRLLTRDHISVKEFEGKRWFELLRKDSPFLPGKPLSMLRTLCDRPT